MAPEDVRWIQRLDHFKKALLQLTKFVEKEELNELEKQGLVQAFEYTYELAWNTLKDFFEAKGDTNLYGSRDVFRLAFRRGLIEDGETWMDMIKKRALTTHTYNEDVVELIGGEIVNRFFPEYVALVKTLEEMKDI